MTKLLAAIMCGAVTGVSIFAAFGSHPELGMFMTISLVANKLRIGLATALLAASLFDGVKNSLFQWTLRIIGLLLGGLALSSLWSERYFGLPIYLRPIDFFIVAEGGILYLLASLEWISAAKRRQSWLSSIEQAGVRVVRYAAATSERYHRA